MTGATGDQPNGRAVKYTTTVMVDKQGRTHVPVPIDRTTPGDRSPTATSLGQWMAEASAVSSPPRDTVTYWSSGRYGHATAVPLPAHPSRSCSNRKAPQRGDLAPDVAAALDVAPDAAAFFDSLAQFYRNAYLRWIDATKRRPDQRPVRVAEMIRLLREGKKQRP